MARTKFPADRTGFRQNITLDILSVSRDGLTDFEDSPKIVKSALCKQVYAAEFGHLTASR
ncbi:type VI secretion system contractile sheath domain-containing protein [Bradyrhizobium sp. USDA 10063]